MSQNFIAVDRDQVLLMPPSLQEWLPADHYAWFVLASVEQMDLADFVAAYRPDGHGRPAHDPAMMGWIQLVVATLDVEELRCREETVLWIVPLRQGRVSGDIRPPVAESIGSGSGRRSLEVHRAKRLRSRRVCCRALVSGGFARVAGCRLSLSRRCLGVICPSPSERRSRSGSLVVRGSGRSPVSWVGRRRRSPESCSGTLRSAPAGPSIGPRPPKHTLTVARDARSRRSSRSTGSCGAMCKPGFPGCAAARRERCGSAGRLARAASGTAKGPALGTVLESGADLRAAAR
jgi:hypothetical protein